MRPLRVVDLVKGDHVYGYMRLGLAIKKVRRVDGYVYGVVPKKPQRIRNDDLTRWQGTVVLNNVAENVLTVQITNTNSLMKPLNSFSLMTDMHYSSLSRLRLLSEISFEPRQDNNTFPANFPDAAFKPYRTFTEVLIPSYVTGH